MIPNFFNGLYAIIDDAAHSSYGLQKLLEQIICESDIPILQLRLKLSDQAQKKYWVERAVALKKHRSCLIIINDEASLLEIDGLDGAHIGQDDGDISAWRERFPNKILGLSTHSWQQATKAVTAHVDYIGCGAVFATPTKPGTTLINHADLEKIGQTIHLPKVAIGGINETNLDIPIRLGFDMVAMISGLIKNGKFAGQIQHEILCHTKNLQKKS